MILCIDHDTIYRHDHSSVAPVDSAATARCMHVQRQLRYSDGRSDRAAMGVFFSQQDSSDRPWATNINRPCYYIYTMILYINHDTIGLERSAMSHNYKDHNYIGHA